jgi:hypothetical protein
MKSSEDVQILPFAWRANRARCVLSIRLKPSKVDTKPGLGALASNYSGGQSNSRKENVLGSQWALYLVFSIVSN